MANKVTKRDDIMSKARNYITKNSPAKSVSKTVPIEDKYPKTTSIKDRQPKAVPIKDVEKPKTVPIKNMLQAYPLSNGKTRFHDGRGNSWDTNLKGKVKSNNWKLEDIGDGIAHIRYPDGTKDEIDLHEDR